MTTLLVAATGGHLKQLHLLHEHVRATPPFVWATFDRPQSRSLLAGEDVEFVHPVGSREVMAALRLIPAADRILRRHRVDAVYSTGSAVALPFFVAGRLRGIRCTYIESAARTSGPSLTGRILARLPGVELRTQYRSWADERWQYSGSVFDQFAPHATGTSSVRRVVVTLGTLDFPFTRLVDRLLEILPADAEILWQTSGTEVRDLPGEVRASMPERDLVAAMRDADVIVAHAGVGSALSAIEAGRAPILVPRRVRHGEHIDDHQELIAQELTNRGLATTFEVPELTFDRLAEAAARGARPASA